MSMTNTPQAATLDDAPSISGVLARAFEGDPMMGWFFPGGASREEDMARYFATVFTRQYARHGVCERTASAAAFWVPPEGQAKAVPDAETIAELEEVLGDRGPLFREAIGMAVENSPQEPHWYLAVVGSDPAARGQGHGAALMRSGLARADATGLPVYLDSSKRDNVPFYEHFGFTVVVEAQLPGDGPQLWVMRREPRSVEA